MITISIIGVLTAIALPSYRDYVERGHRAEAITNLTQMGMLIEQHRALLGRYCLDTCAGTVTETFTYSEADDGTPSTGTNRMGSGQNYLSGFRPKQAATGAAGRYSYRAVVGNDSYALMAAPITSRGASTATLTLDDEGSKTETVGSTVTNGW